LISTPNHDSSSPKRYLPNNGPPLTPLSLAAAKSDHTYHKSPRTAAKRLSIRGRNLFKQLDASKKKCERKQKRIVSIRLKLEESKTVGPKKLKVLEDKYPSILKQLVESQQISSKCKGKTGIRYNDEMKKFAVTLHFYSPRAYDFIREYLTLPHPSSLTSWMQSSNCEPGFQINVIERLRDARVKNGTDVLRDIVLQVDEMALRKDASWDQNRHKFVGYVDFGAGDECESPSLATNALVALIAGISGGWKVPIGYIFTDKVDGRQMKQFVCRAFDLLEDNGFEVHALVSDGNTANVNMFEHLGVIEGHKSNDLPLSFDNIQSVFPNPRNQTKSVGAVYDIVHMMKLWRNLLAQCGEITWESGTIEWKYIKELYKIQAEEKIVAANKLDRNHIEFERHKMKVKFAVQCLSSSVADAIDFCREDLKNPLFAGSASTCEFIRLLDSVFDILNTRHPKQKGKFGYLVMNLKNFEKNKAYLETFCSKLLTMEYFERRNYKGNITYKKKLLCQSARKRAVIGFIISIKSILTISETLIKRSVNPLHYVLTYRFSQDLLELFFNKIRGRCGRNNNPSAIEFINIMKNVWHQNLLKSTNTGNCIVLDKECLMAEGMLPLKRRPKKQIASDSDMMSMSLDCLLTRENSDFYRNCLAYIAGNVVRKLCEKLMCLHCIVGLFDCAEDSVCLSDKLLITRKDRGGLQTPSKSVFRIIEFTDSIFRTLVEIHSGPPSIKNLDLKISVKVISYFIGANLFPQISGHIIEFDPETSESHMTVLIKSIVSEFLKIRLYDLGRRHMKSLNVSSRHSLTKQILFRHE
jgi:hypothetical protein